jgi:hypothetical protein
MESASPSPPIKIEITQKVQIKLDNGKSTLSVTKEGDSYTVRTGQLDYIMAGPEFKSFVQTLGDLANDNGSNPLIPPSDPQNPASAPLTAPWADQLMPWGPPPKRAPAKRGTVKTELARQRWNPQDEQLAADLLKAGMTYESVAGRLKRSPDSIRARYYGGFLGDFEYQPGATASVAGQLMALNRGQNLPAQKAA